MRIAIMATPRSSLPYISATWLSKLLGGDNQCEWSYWFQAHHKINKRASTFDEPTWRMDHTALLKSVIQDLENDEFKLRIEQQNKFFMEGETAILGGTPDIIAIKGDDAIVVDAKTGKESQSHMIQVMIYMWAVPRAFPQFKGLNFRGMIQYKDSHKFIKPEKIDKNFIGNMVATIKRLASDEPCRKVPSYSECRFCNITKDDCPEIVEIEPESASGRTDAF